MNPLIIVLAFVCELVDSTLGMGYGTTLTPLLLAFGLEPLEIVPAILCSEAITGILAGIVHHEFGNVDFKRGSKDLKVMLVLAGLSAAGVIFAVIVAINLPTFYIKLYIGLLVLILGVIILVNHKKEFPFSWKRIGILGWIAAFNKGISGGGYGPVVTSGQMLSGVKSKKAVGIASLAEGITSVVGLIVYFLHGNTLDGYLTASLLIGAVLSVPLSAYIVSKVPVKRMTVLIGAVTLILGIYTLANLFI